MINPWLRGYLVLSLVGLDIAEGVLQAWRQAALAPLRGGPARPLESWLTVVRPARAAWARSAVVYNCAAAAYSAHGVNVSRLSVANQPRWRGGCCGA